MANKVPGNTQTWCSFRLFVPHVSSWEQGRRLAVECAVLVKISAVILHDRNLAAGSNKGQW